VINTDHKAARSIVFPVTSSLLCPDMLFSTLFSNTSAYVSPSMWATKCHTHIK